PESRPLHRPPAHDHRLPATALSFALARVVRWRVPVAVPDADPPLGAHADARSLLPPRGARGAVRPAAVGRAATDPPSGGGGRAAPGFHRLDPPGRRHVPGPGVADRVASLAARARAGIETVATARGCRWRVRAGPGPVPHLQLDRDRQPAAP